MNNTELDSRNIAVSMRKSVENLVISSQDAIGQSISQALTFSGVITQHANQIINQENRNVSRSPSPSSKGTESNNSSTVENEKQQSDFSLQVPVQGSGDNLSITSQVESASVNTKSETANKGTGNPSKTSEGPRAKKKSWYSAFYPTYKSRSEDFKKLFKDVPDDERLIVDYSCALQKDILAHGRLYVSQNYLCFYANIFGWETSLSHRWKDVTAITKEKTALVIPNAILICTENEKNFLTSFSGRDKAYLMLFRVWQNALMDQPMSSQEIWQWVHSCYGEELGFNSDDEEYMRDVSDEEKVVAAVGHIDIAIEEVRTSLYVESCSMEGVGGDDGVDKPDGGEEHVTHNLRDAGEGRRSADDGDAQPTDMSDTSDSEPDDKNNDESLVCNLNHEGRLMCQAEVPINIDQMFTMIFTNSKFNLELLAERGISDYTQTAWQHDVKVGLKCRQIKYTMSLSSGPIGPKEVYVTETQVMNKCSKPGILYSIDATSENAGIPYGDCFSVCVHYCLKRISEQVTSLTLYSQLKYKKSVWPMVKVFLEKNTTSGLDEYAKLLDIRLKLEAEGGAPAKRKGRRRRRVAGITAIAAQETSVPAVVQSAVASSSVSVPRGSVSRARGRNSNGTKWLIACLLVLLAINALLYWRLYISERPKGFGFEDLQDRMSTLTAEQMAEVSRALERHSHAQRDQLLAWRAALHRAVHTLKQTEQALSNLLESIKPSLDKAQQDAVKHPPLRTDL